MMKTTLPLWLAFSFLLAGSAHGQVRRGQPEIGYLYPAGAQQGTVVKVLVGGQNLRNLKSVHVSGEGVRASVVRYNGRFVRLNGEERVALVGMLIEAREVLGAEIPEQWRRWPT